MDPLAFLAGDSEMGEHIRACDWMQTPLGPVESWPQSLKTSVQILLNSRYPMFVWWGRELTNIYNDAYIPVLGTRHPQALGQPAPRIWTDIWPVVGPQAELVLNEGRATWNESVLLMMERHGYSEETYFTFSYSPLPDDNGAIGGVFCACTEDTQRVIGERQLALLRDLAARTANTRTWQEACTHSADALSSNPHDLPFAMIYIADSNGSSLSLAGFSGIEHDHAAAPAVVSLGEQTPWPLAAALGARDVIVVEDLQSVIGVPLPSGAWPQAPSRAALVPIAATGQTGRGGVLVVGLNPFRLFDDGYRNVLTLVGGQISASITSAQAYEEEKKRAEALAELDRAKTAFFSNISHEFRTPLTLMLGPVEEMLEESSDLAPAAKDQLEIVHRNSLRLLKLVNTMLDFSRIEAGRIQAEYEAVDLAEYTADLASVFRAAIERAGLRLLVNCPPLSEPVYVDRDMWEKIVLNLLSNAFKFTLAGEIEVRLEASAGQARLTVRDTGVGIPAAEMPRLFERFHRVSESRGRTHEGTGIGLALVQELVKLHGGAVHAESVLNKGSQFVVSVPLGQAHLDPQHIWTQSDLTPTKTSGDAFVQEALRWLPDPDYRLPIADFGAGSTDDVGSLQSKIGNQKSKILLADDNADMREYVSRLLGERFAVETVADGRAALTAARAHPPDLILADVMMPKLDGLGLLHALRTDAQLRDIPIILLSARADEEARIEGMEAGADDYLIKPFSARELLARIESHIKIASMHAQMNRTLRESEERYRAIVEGQAEMVCRFRPDGTILFVNGAYARARGTTPETLLEANFWDFIEQEDRPDVQALLERLRPEAPEIRIENRFETAAGVRWTLWTNRGLAFDADGRATEVQSAGIDITERKQVEQALHDSEAKLSAIIERLPVGVGVTDAQGRTLSLNPAGLRLHGFASLDEMLVHFEQYREEFELRYPDGRLMPADEWPLARALRGEYVHEYEVRLRRHSDGEEKIVSFSAVPVSEGRDGTSRVVFVTHDVTDRKRAEETLRESERQLALVIDTAPAFIAHCDRACRFRFVNRAYTERFGLTPDDVIGKHVSEVLGPSAYEAMQPHIAAVLAGRTVEFETEVELPTKGRRYMHARYAPEVDAQDEVSGFVAVITDITERKQAEAALRESEARYRTLFESIDEGFCVVEMLFDAHGEPVDYRWLETNPAFERHTGLVDAVGKTARELVPGLEHHWVEIYGRVALTGAPERFVAESPAMGRWFEVDAFRIGAAEERKVALLFNDITEWKRAEAALRESEERLRLALDAAGMGVWEVHAGAGASRVDAGMGRLFGLAPGTENMPLRHFYRVIHANDRKKVARRMRAAWEHGGEFDAEFRVILGDEERWLVGRGRVLEDGGERRMFGVNYDVTARKRAEAALRRLNETLEERVEERTRQVRKLASRLTMAEQEERRRISQILHDNLQQLLYGIEMKMNMICRDLQEAAHPELAEDLSGASVWVDQAITTTRQLTVDLSPPILQNQGLADALEWLQRQMKELHGLEVVVKAAHSFYIPNEDLRVLLFQIVRELLFNVKKHARVDRVTVKLTEEAEHLVIHVIDTGQGFDVDEVASRAEQASGFGLFSIRERLGLLDGRLEVCSRPGQGTHVAVYAPMPSIRSEQVIVRESRRRR